MSKIIFYGGTIRWEEDTDYYLRINRGINSLIMMDFVNGYSVGPQMTFGKVLDDYSRIEIDETVRWACSRKKLMAKGVIRYVFAPQFFGFFEFFGGRYTNDFDRYPVMDESLRSFASGLFGWSHFKLYDQTTFGTRLYGALSKDLQINGVVAWEKRQEVTNHRQSYIFGKQSDDNVPVVQGERMSGFGNDKILRIDCQLDWMPGRKILIVDDMETLAHSDNPDFSLRVTSGWNSGLRFLSLDASVMGIYRFGEKSPWLREIKYHASTGFFPVRNNVLLMDARHFDASQFAYHQTSGKFSFSQFSLLDNYQLSTSRYWFESHAETTKIIKPIDSHLYLQAHFAKVYDRPLHSEFAGGVDFANFMRLGTVIGFNDMHYDGVAVTFSLNL